MHLRTTVALPLPYVPILLFQKQSFCPGQDLFPEAPGQRATTPTGTCFSKPLSSVCQAPWAPTLRTAPDRDLPCAEHTLEARDMEMKETDGDMGPQGVDSKAGTRT